MILPLFTQGTQLDLWFYKMPHHHNQFKLNTDFTFMCFCGYCNQVKADKTHFVAPRREGDFGLYLVCRTVYILSEQNKGQFYFHQ